MITIKQRGDFRNTEEFFKRSIASKYFSIFDKYGREGIAALVAATPVDSGLTADSWGYLIRVDRDHTTISWTNSNNAGGAPIAILIQYGHATKNGSYVNGRDFINPAIRPIFDRLADEIWKEVTKV